MVLAVPAAAEGLEGYEVTVQVVVRDVPRGLLLESLPRTALVRPGPEFDLGPDPNPALSIVPVTVDIEGGSIRFDYTVAGGAGGFAEAAFNGYVFGFSPCLSLTGAEIATARGIDLNADALRIVNDELFINVSALTFTAATRIEIALDAEPCPMS
ncbi:MAG: hypothetical protein AAF914_02630 [Pseudomonadota bacterium]